MSIEMRLPQWFNRYYGMQALNVTIFAVNIGVALLPDNKLPPLSFGTAGFIVGLMVANHLARRISRSRDELLDIVEQQNEMIRGMMEMKVSEIGEQIATQMKDHIVNGPPKVTRH